MRSPTELKRFFSSVPLPVVAAVVALALPIALGAGLLWLAVSIAGAGFLLLIVQTWLEYRRRQFDPTLALKYQEVFDEKMRAERGNAARAALEFLQKKDWRKVANADEIEPVLDFFDDLGFYLKGDHISDEVTHHHFYHWIRVYVQVAEPYIRERQQDEPKTWEHCLSLLARVSAVESSISESVVLPDETLTKYLREELTPAGNAGKG